MTALHTLVTAALNEINNINNTATIHLADWSTWKSHNAAPTITINHDTAYLWLQEIDIILKAIYAQHV